MIIIHNLTDLNKFKQLFKTNHPIFETLKEIMRYCKESKKSAFICQIILNLFFEEYKEKFFLKEDDDELNDIYIKYFYEFSSIYPEALDVASAKTYALLLNNLCLFNIKEEEIKQKILDENTAMIGKTCENVIELIFSKEKYAYINLNNNNTNDINIGINNENNLHCYEIKFFEGILEKYIKKIREEYNSISNTLFRKEDFCNEIIKSMFFSFGNSCFISSFCII